jgi:hypothetical protein
MRTESAPSGQMLIFMILVSMRFGGTKSEDVAGSLRLLSSAR